VNKPHHERVGFRCAQDEVLGQLGGVAAIGVVPALPAVREGREMGPLQAETVCLARDTRVLSKFCAWGMGHRCRTYLCYVKTVGHLVIVPRRVALLGWRLRLPLPLKTISDLEIAG